MNSGIKVGLNQNCSLIVSKEHTAINHKSGTLEVFATPAMVALMENAAMNVVSPYLAVEQTTVGTNINVSHIKATPIGARVNANALLTQVDGRMLVFEVKAHDEDGEIGSGTHIRYIVDKERFMGKVLESR